MSRFLLPFLIFLGAGFSTTAQTASMKTLLDQGVALHDQGRYSEALLKYKEARREDSLNEDANYEIAHTYSAMEKWDDAIRHADLVIRHGKKNVTRAYMVKGNALDAMHRPKEAIQNYKDGLKLKDDGNYLLHYNLALTYYNNDIDDKVEAELKQALSLNPNHASSHLLLGVSMAEAGRRAPAVLALYHFLLLEADSRRSKGVLAMLDKQVRKGVSKEGESQIRISVPMHDQDDPFTPMELMLSMLEASKSTGGKQDKSEQELFQEQTEAFFSMLVHLKKEKSGDFWWKTYGDLFTDLTTNKHLETFCYYVRQSEENPAVIAWLEKNPRKIEDFANWYEGRAGRK